MDTLQVELKNKNALSILKSLEKAQMIKLISKEPKTEKSPVRLKDTLAKKKSVDAVNKIEKSKKGQKRTFGYAKDAIILKPDFDEPLDDFKEYMV